MPHLLSLTRAGVQNGTRVRTEADEIVTSDASGALRAFRDLAGAAVFSTNVDASKITDFDAHDAILDSRAVRIHRAGDDEEAGLRAFETEQEQWAVPRMGFEALWRHGSRFVYGAVNAGGMGVEHPSFGSFCLVIDEPARAADAIAVFPSDSAQRYGSTTGAPDRERARAEAVAWRDRGHVATIERASEAATTVRPAWPWLICNPGRYLETIVAPGPQLHAVGAVRLRRTYLERLDDLTVAGSEDPLEAATEQRELRAIETLRRWRADHDIAIEAVG